MKSYNHPMLQIVSINQNDIITTSVTSTDGNVFSGPVIGGHGNAMAPGNHRIWDK